MGRRGFVAAAHGLHCLRIARQVAEPGPAHRYAGTHGFSLVEGGLVVRPDQRVFVVVALVTQDLRALLGDNQLGAAITDAPAIEIIELYQLDFRRGHAVISFQDHCGF
ncbi:hypothetical protein D3C80_1715220 [compost metagenome]